MDARSAANAADYHEACSEFLKCANFDTIRRLDQALSRVSPEHIDISEAESLVRQIRPCLDTVNTSNLQFSLYCCQLVVRFQVKKPGSLWVNSIDITEKIAGLFRDLVPCFMRDVSDSKEISLLIELIELWGQLINTGRIEEEYVYLLMVTALQWIFTPKPAISDLVTNEWQLISRKFVHFVALTYSQFEQDARDRVLHDILSSWFKSGEEFSGKMVELVLSLVAVSGQVKFTVWEEAMMLKSRQLLDTEVAIKHQAAVATATLISRRIIDWSWSVARSNGARRLEVQRFLEESANRLKSPQWPAAEVFMSAFISCLFKFAKVIRNQKYPVFLFHSLRTIQDSIPIAVEVDESNIPTIVKRAIKSCNIKEQASYLAARQCMKPGQPYSQYFEALNQAKTGEHDQELVEQWPMFLSQWPISTYHSQISQVLSELAIREDLRDIHQVELFKVMEKTKIFDIKWLDRLRYAVPIVCESLVPLVAMDFQANGNILPVKKLCVRVAAPGASGFKKRCVSLLISIANTSIEATSLAWKYSLVCAGDSETGVQQAGLKACEELRGRGFLNSTTNKQAFSEAFDSDDTLLVQRGVAAFVRHLTTSTTNGRAEVQQLVKQLIQDGELKLAVVFLKVDGTFMPMSEIAPLFDLAVSSQSNGDASRKKSLEILDLALCARPRIIISQSQVAKMFNELVSQLKWCSEVEIEHVGSILDQLAGLDTPRNQSMRFNILNRIAEEKSLAAAKRIGFSATFDANLVPVLNQSLLICGCVRYWSNDIATLRAFCHTFIDMMDAKHAMVSSLTRLVIIRVVFAICSKHCALFADIKIEEFLNKFEASSIEADCVTKLLLKHMSDHSSKNNASHSRGFNGQAQSSAATSAKDKRARFFGLKSESTAEAEVAASLMLQKHVSRLIELAKSEEDASALRVVVKALDENLIVADECISTIVTLCFSVNPEVSQTSLRSFASLCERFPRNFGVKFVEGLRMINYESCDIKPLPAMWSIYKESRPQRNIKPMLDHLTKILKYSTPLAVLTLIIQGLSEVEMASKDAKQLVLGIEDELNRFEPDKHERSDGTAMVLVHVFSYWLRRRYGLSEYNRLSKFGVKGEDADMEPMDCEAIITRFEELSISTKDALKELWRLPDYYGTQQMNDLIYGKRKRSRDEDDI